MSINEKLTGEIGVLAPLGIGETEEESSVLAALAAGEAEEESSVLAALAAWQNVGSLVGSKQIRVRDRQAVREP